MGHKPVHWFDEQNLIRSFFRRARRVPNNGEIVGTGVLEIVGGSLTGADK